MWPFTRKHRRPNRIAATSSNDIWRPGDIAECVIDTWRTRTVRQPRRGSRSIVTRVYRDNTGMGLELIGYPWRWNATAFRKVTEPTIDAEDGLAEPISSPACLPAAVPRSPEPAPR